MQLWNSMVFQNGFPLWLQVATDCYLLLSQTAPNLLASFRQWGELLPVFFPTRDLCCAHLISFITPVGSTINKHLCFHMIRNMDAIIVATKFKCSALLLFSWAVTGCMMLFYSRNNSSCASAALSQSMYKLKRIRTKTHNPINWLWTLLQYYNFSNTTQ